MGTRERPYLITPPAPREERRGRSARERSRNRLAINYISDGTPELRCELRPLDEHAAWILEHRPLHIALHYDLFGLCVNASTCEECGVYKRSKP